MTLPGTITAATPAAPAERSIWRAEIVETAKLAWPMALTQLGQIAMMTTDLALIGRLGSEALAAQAFGARNPRLVRRSLRVGLWAAVMLGIPVNAVQQIWGEDILLAAGQSPDSAALAARYLSSLAWSMIPAWC